MRLAFDAMGGDFGPSVAIEGALLFARAHPRCELLLVGDTGVMEAHLSRLGGAGRLALHHATQVAAMDEAPSVVLREKRDSSINACMELLARGQADAVVSAGSSGATVASARSLLGRLEGVERPPLAARLPTAMGKRVVLLDTGASVECAAEHLLQHAFLGEAFAASLLGRRARVALLSNGEERSKGTESTRRAYALLERSDLDFAGYVEPRRLCSGEIDVAVTDGFTGNMVLKAAEGAQELLKTSLKRELSSRPIARLAVSLLVKSLGGLRRELDWSELNGAALLGVNGLCVVAHGSSSAKGIVGALGIANELAAAAPLGGMAAAAARYRAAMIGMGMAARAGGTKQA